MVLGKNKNTEERKRKQERREKLALQDSHNTGSIEQQEVQRKKKKKDNENSPTFDVKSARLIIERILKGKIVKYNNYRDPKTNEIKTNKEVITTTRRKLCNEDAANRYLNYANNVLNHNTISSNLTPSQIQKMTLGTMGPVFDETIFKHHINGIGYKNTEDAGTIISTIRNPVITALNKARYGRMIESNEKVRVEKSVENITEDKQKDDYKDKGMF